MITSSSSSSTRRRTARLLAFLCVLPLAANADAWNGKGHMTVAAAAWKDLAPETRAKASALLRLNPDYPNWVQGVAAEDVDMVAFVRAATWPDQIRSTYTEDGSSPKGSPTEVQNIGFVDCLKHRYWHFDDIPFSTDGTPLEDASEPNAVTQIRTLSTALANPITSDDVKSYDLAWLLHLVGDIHQPLHATARFTQQSKHGDSGGNAVILCPRRGMACSQRFNSLHAFWDDALGTGDSALGALRLACLKPATASSHCLPQAPAEALAIDDPGTWAQESFQLARAVAYKRPIGAGKGPYYLTKSYQASVGSTAEKQVALGGARLAKLLNQALASGVPGQVTPPPLPDASACPRLSLQQ